MVAIMECNDDVPPPLEDCTEMLAQMCFQPNSKSKSNAAANPAKKGGMPNSTSSANENAISQSKGTGATAGNKTTAAGSGAKKNQKGGSTGLRRGFFNNPKPSSSTVKRAPTTKSPSGQEDQKSKSKSESEREPQSGSAQKEKEKEKVEEIPFLRAGGGEKGKAGEKDRFRFDEVQDAMKKSESLLGSKEWITGDLLEQVAADPLLSRGLSDPRMAKVLEDLQKNPQEAMKKYGDKPELRMFMERFCSLLGSHFTRMGEEEDKKAEDAAVQKAAEASSDPEVERALGDPEVRKALQHPDVMALLNELRTNPGAAQRRLQSAGSELRGLVGKLVSAGLLKLA